MSDQNKKQRLNAWKRYGAIFMAGIVMTGTAAGACFAADTVYAEEEQRITMRVADDAEEETAAKTTEEEEKRITLQVADQEKETEEKSKKENTDSQEETDKKADRKKSDKEEGKEASEKNGDEGKSDKEENAEASKKNGDEAKSDKEEDKKSAKEENEEETEKVTTEETDAETDEEQSGEKENNKKDAKEYAQLETAETTDGGIEAADFSEVAENIAPSLVLIENAAEQETQDEIAPEQYGGRFSLDGYLTEETVPAEAALVSGIVIAQNDEELLIATSSYISSETNELKVWFAADEDEKNSDGVPAKIKGVDSSDGLAVVAVQLSDIPEDVYEQIKVAPLGVSEDLKVGQPVLAAGHETDYGCNLTTGIVSALDREFELDGVDTQTFLTDAAAYGAGPGGAVLNTKGEVIGISVAYGEGGMNYAVPVDAAVPVLERLANKETRDKMDNAERGYLGATVVNVNEDAKELYDMPEGAFVYEVTEGSAADQAGIRKGDIITKFDGEAVSSSDDLIDMISYYAVGETVTVELQTANNGSYESREAEVTLQAGEEASAKQENASEQKEKEDAQQETSDEMPEDAQQDERSGFSDEKRPSMEEGFRRFPFYFFENGGF